MALLYQLDASVIGTMFSNTGKTTQITDGGGVAAWAAPNGSVTTDALQSTSGNRATYRANYSSSGYPAVEFDGTNDQFSVAHSASWNVSIIDLFVVLNSTNNATLTPFYRGIVTKFGTSAWSTGWGCLYALGWLNIGAPDFLNHIGKAVINQRILCHFHFENRASGCDQGQCYIGSNNSAATGPGNTSADVLIGGAISGAYNLAGAIHEILVYTGGETDAVILGKKNDLRVKWGLTGGVASSGGIPIARGMHGGMR